MTIAEIQKMNIVEKIQTMELLWDSLLKDENKIESPDWHQDILKERTKKINNNEAHFISLDELKARHK